MVVQEKRLAHKSSQRPSCEEGPLASCTGWSAGTPRAAWDTEYQGEDQAAVKRVHCSVWHCFDSGAGLDVFAEIEGWPSSNLHAVLLQQSITQRGQKGSGILDLYL